MGSNKSLEKFLKRTLAKFTDYQKTKHDAFVNIGGSIFQDKTKGKPAIDFATEEKPDFSVTSQKKAEGNTFVIGSNLGPAYSQEHWKVTRGRLDGYSHVCLRDYSSYCMVKDMKHVQYAPDVIFMAEKPQNQPKCEHVVVSVIDISRHTSDEAVIGAYYNLLRDTVVTLSAEKIPVTLVSFCKEEQDEKAINKLMKMLPDKSAVNTHFYDGDIDATMEVINSATFVIASRFHSMILGFSFDKPVFPFVYNCKTLNYMRDLQFVGKYATFDNICSLTSEDILYNYRNNVITDCSEHKKYAENQFRALREYMDKL
ncbi:MAG: polysaccharide pyruvyl transferase family protein [Oscillospiraceae bacterium]|nr:polysaccharide pyruvyl transferase family protein [Oscillospiraceae bacterium]